MTNRNRSLRLAILLSMAAVHPLIAAAPAVGEKAPDFALLSLEGKTVRLSDVIAKSPVVLVVLRGYPGYQCPICNRQVQDYLRNAQGFAEVAARVVMVYPGPPENLGDRAKAFTADKKFPANFMMLLDPGYQFTTLYGLRWDAPSETAYPSTFLIDRQGIVFFARVSNSHGGRTNPTEMIELLKKKNSTK